MAMSAGVEASPVALETIREVTRAVLAQPEFTEPSRWYETLIEFLKAIKEWLDGLSAWSEANPTLARVLFVLALLILIACLAHLLYLAFSDMLPFGRKRAETSAPAPRMEILEGVAKDWREALEVARRMLAENDPRRAIWIAHRVLLGLLDQQGAIKFAVWKTNSHYLRECAQEHPWYKTFAELSETYEQAVYARRNTPAEIAESLLLRVDRLYGEAAAAA
jgi:hypothetical protein